MRQGISDYNTFLIWMQSHKRGDFKKICCDGQRTDIEDIYVGIFDSDWQRLHKKVSPRYELIALRNLETGMSTESTDVFGIINEIVRESLPHLSPSEAEQFVKDEYGSFKHFDVCEAIRDALRKMNPAIPESGVSEIFHAVRLRFKNPEKDHEYLLFFIISKFIELEKLSISRGAYLIEISRGRIPRPSRFVRLFQMWRQIARYKMAKHQGRG